MSQEFPHGWAKTKLNEVTEQRAEKVAPQSMPDVAYIGLEDVESHSSRITSVKKAAEYKSSSARFYLGDVLYGRLRPYLNKVVKPDFDGLASAEFIVLKASQAIYANFLKRIVSSPDFLSFTAGIPQGDRPRVDFGQIGE